MTETANAVFISLGIGALTGWLGVLYVATMWRKKWPN